MRGPGAIRLSRAALGPLMLLSVLVLLMFWRTPPARPNIAPPQAITWNQPPELPRSPDAPLPTPMPLTGQFIQRAALDIVSTDGLFDAAEQAALAGELEQALSYASARFGSDPSGRISTYVGTEPDCGLHGIAYTDQRMVQVFTCPHLPRSRAVAILAHEFVHQLAHDRYGPRHLEADLILLEGVATWGAGAYWLDEHPDFASLVREYYGSGPLLPLATSYAGRPIADMNQLYYQWASFVEFLIDTYGREPFDRLYVTGRGAPGTADYAGVYGKSLDVLEQEWRRKVEG